MSLALESIHRRATAQSTVDTPLGEMLLVRTADGLAGAWFTGQAHHPGTLAAPVDPDDAVLSDAARQLDRYFAGEREPFDLPLDLNGTEFQRTVWAALRRIAIGHTQSYGDIARQLGQPSAVRAVGAAVGRNPLSLIVPCHRVLGADGSLTGYAGGTQRKKALLEMELQQRGLEPLAQHRAMNSVRRSLLVGTIGIVCGDLLAIGQVRAAQREVEDLALGIELPDDWIPIPRAEILEARDRAVASGASTEWTVRAAWQPPPHLRWFTLPHLTLESRAAQGMGDTPPAIEHVAGRSGARTVYTHRAAWRSDGLDQRLTLLSFDERRDEFERWVASLRRLGPARS